jgi:hypothetical protein
MRNYRKSLFAVVLTTSSVAMLFAVARTVIAQGSGRIQARSQIRTTTEPCACSPIKGDVLLVQDGAQQTLTLKVKGLTESDLYIHVSTNSFYDGTNSPVYAVAPLTRTDKRKGDWFRKLTGTSGAPLEFQVLGIGNLSDMSDINSLVIGNPGVTNIIGGTNFYDCVQTVTNDVTVITCSTNVLGGVTNIFIDAFAWAPIPPLVANASVFSFKERLKLQRPFIPPSPQAVGSMRIAYNGLIGESLLDIKVSGLSQGQSYVLWVSDGGTNVAAGNFTVPKGGGGGRARFLRDTKMGDPLPLQAASTATLTNRLFTVRDASGSVHLFGVLP